MNTARTIRRVITATAMAALCALIALPAYAAYEDSLKGYWKMDEFNWNDNFSGTNGSAPDSSRWGVYVQSGSTVGIQDNKLQIHNPTSGGYTGSDAFSAFSLSGDFDVQVDYSIGSSVDSNLWLGFIYIAIDGNNRVDVQRRYENGNIYRATKHENGVQTDVNGGTTADTAGRFRVTREGDVWTLYRTSDMSNNPAWTQLTTSSSVGTGNAQVLLITQSINPALTFNFDNFRVNDQSVTDATGSSSSGTALGATSVAGKTGFGNALNFNGTSDYVKIPDADNLSFGNSVSDSPLTFSAWVNMNDATHARIFTKSDGAGTDEYRFMVNGSDKLSLVLYDGGLLNYLRVDSSVSLTSCEGDWAYLAATYDGSGSANGIKLFVNGQEVDEVTNSVGTYTAMHNTDRFVEVGSTIGNGWYFNGSMDDPAMWSRALDSNEIAMIYDLGTEKFEWLTLGVNDPDALNLGYTTSELKLLAELYADGNTSASETIDGLTWHYLSGDLPGDIGGTTYDYGDTWTYDGKYYLKLGSGLEGAGSVPEPGCVLGLLVGFFVPGFRRLFKRRVRG